MEILLGSLLVGSPLLIFELISRTTNIAPEISRKLIHVFTSLATIALTLFLPLNGIAIIAVIFIIILAVLRSLKFWKSLYNVDRYSWGEIAFAVGVLASSLLAPNYSAFICAIAIMGLADTAAAVIGIKYGKYKILKTNKSYLGSLAFAVIASIIFLLTDYGGFMYIVPGVFIATVVELLSPIGLDNATVPLVIVLWINFLIY